MTGVYRFVGFVVFLVVLEAAVVAVVILVPDARQTLISAVEDTREIWVGSETERGNFDVLSDAVGEFYSDWIQPLAGPPPIDEQSAEFGECIDCHPTYATKTRFSTVLMNHPLHAQLGLECATCHTDVAHPQPLAPSESTCSSCHSETSSSGQPDACTLCHPPGRLTHYQQLGVREAASVNCSTCHLPGTLGGGGSDNLIEHHRFDGAETAICMECHQSADCASCHTVDHPEDWPTEHGQDVLFGSLATCNRCHSSQWCAGACHDAGTLFGDRLLPLPSGGDE